MMSLIYSLLVLLLLCPTPALGRAEIAEPPALTPATPRQVRSDLEILSVTPHGRLDEAGQASSIMVVFDRPVGALEALPNEEFSGPLLFSPPIAGRYRWFGTDTLVFVPHQPLKPGTRYTACVPAGTKAQDGSKTGKDYRWTFETIRPRLVRFRPYDGESFVKTTSFIVLVFNQDVSAEKAAPFLTLLGKPTLALFSDIGEFRLGDFRDSFAIRVRGPTKKDIADHFVTPDEAPRTLILEPRKPLKPEHTYALRIRKGMTAALGNLGTTEDFVFQFKTYNRFRSLGVTQVAHPRQGLEFLFSNPVSRRELGGNVIVTPSVDIETEADDVVAHQHHLGFDLKPRKFYAVEISPGLKDEFGNKLRVEWSGVVQTTSFVPEISAPTAMIIIESALRPVLPVKTVNIEAFTVMTRPVLTGEAVSILSQNEFEWPWEAWQSSGLVKSTDVQINSSLDEEMVTPFDLSSIIAEDNSPFVFALVKPKAPRNDAGDFPLSVFKELSELGGHRFESFSQVTGIGITAKCSAENFAIWVSSLATGEPIPEAFVELRDDKGNILQMGRTGTDGACELPGWATLQDPEKNERGGWGRPNRIWIVAIKNSDTALISSTWGENPRRLGAFYFERESNYKSAIYTDRPIYKLGETVHIKGVVRAKKMSRWSLPNIKTLDVSVFDPRDQRALEQSVNVSPFGSFLLDFGIDRKGSVGNYSIRIKDSESTAYNSSSQFRVEPFYALNFDVKAKLEGEHFLPGDSARARVEGQYLFGAPMVGGKGRWTIEYEPAAFSPPGHDGYDFSVENAGKTPPPQSGDIQLDADGKAAVQFDFLERPPGCVAVNFEATVIDMDGERVSARSSALLHPASFYIGLSVPSYFNERGKPVTVSIIASDLKGQLIGDRDVQIHVLRREMEPVRRTVRHGEVKWERRTKDVIIENASILTRGEPFKLELNPDAAGHYIIQAESRDNDSRPVSADLDFYVHGREYVPWGFDDEKRIEVVPDKIVYRPGETARLMVKSPFERGTALVSVEREGVLTQFSTQVFGGADVVSVPIIEDYAPRVFVSVCVIRGRDGEAEYSNGEGDAGPPSFAMDYASIQVDNQALALRVKISPSQPEYRPQDSAELNIQITDHLGNGKKAEFSVAVVDKGVLDLAGGAPPDLMGVFYGEQNLGVTTVDSRQPRRIRPLAREIMLTSGRDMARSPSPVQEKIDGGLRERGENARSDFLNTVFWVGSVLTDDSGRANLSFDLPDNLTTMAVVGVAHTKESQFGTGEATFQVKKPLMIKSALPRFVRLGDRFRAGVLIHNQTGRREEVAVEAKSQGIQLNPGWISETFSANGQIKQVECEFIADKMGESVVEFRAQLGDEQDAARFTLPIINPLPLETVALAKDTIREEETEKIRIPDNVHTEVGGLYLEAASTALLGLKEGVRYLQGYRHECLEQQISRVLPFLTAWKMLDALGLASLKEKDKISAVNELLSDLPRFQGQDGGFKFWPEAVASSDFLTAYALEFAAVARRSGFVTDETVIASGLGYIKRKLERGEAHSAKPKGRSENLDIKAYFYFVQALWGEAHLPSLEAMQGSLERLSIFGKTMLLKAMFHASSSPSLIQAVERHLMNFIRVDSVRAHFEEEAPASAETLFNSSVRTTALILRAFLDANRELPQAPKIARWLMDKRISGRWANTQEDVRAIDALSAYFEKFETDAPELWGSIHVGGREALRKKFSGSRRLSEEARVPMSELFAGQETTVRVIREGKGRLFYGIRLAYAPREIQGREEGLLVKREILYPDGSPAPLPIPLGSKLLIKLTIVTPVERSFVAVEDWLPGCFEVINPYFATTAAEDRRGAVLAHPFIRREFHDERVNYYADTLKPGAYDLTYLVLAKTKGRFHLPPATAAEMYGPDVFGRTGSGVIEVK